MRGFFDTRAGARMPRERKAKEEKTGYRTDLGLLEAVVSIAGNLFLFTVKLIIGIAIRSMAAIADAVHTFSDIASSIVVFVGFKISGREPGFRTYPHGHGRMENIATLVIAVLLVVTGLELVVSAVKRLFAPQVVGGGWWVSAVFIFAALSKEAMARFAFKLGKEIDSEALVADGWHHRADAVPRFWWLPGTLWRSGAGTRWTPFWERPLPGWSSIPVETPSLPATGCWGPRPHRRCSPRSGGGCDGGGGQPGPWDQVHDYGFHQEISLHIEVPPGLDLAAAHQVADEVEKKLARVLGAGVVVHVDIDSQAGEPATPPGPLGE